MKALPAGDPVWSSTPVQCLYKHRNGSYYVRTKAGGKQKWVSLKTKLLSVARNRMKEHVEAAERARGSETAVVADTLAFSDALTAYRRALELSAVQPNTKLYRASGLKKLLKTWPEIEQLNVRKITAPMVERWLFDLKAKAKPFTPPGAKGAAKNSTGASTTTLKCALDALSHVLDVAVRSGCIAANPARNASVKEFARKMFKATRRERAERGGVKIPARAEFGKVVEAIRGAKIPDCKAAAEFVQCGIL